MNKNVQHSHNICQTPPWNLTNQDPNNDNIFGYMLILLVTHIFSHIFQHEQIANVAFKKHSSEGKWNDSKYST